MKSLSHVAEPLCQLCLDEHMNVLGVRVELKCAAVDVGEDAFQPLDNGEAVLLGDYAAVSQHGSVGDTALYIVAVHTSVKGYGRIERVYSRVDLL